jgi:hypothetical protein
VAQRRPEPHAGGQRHCMAPNFTCIWQSASHTPALMPGHDEELSPVSVEASTPDTAKLSSRHHHAARFAVSPRCMSWPCRSRHVPCNNSTYSNILVCACCGTWRMFGPPSRVLFYFQKEHVHNGIGM